MRLLAIMSAGFALVASRELPAQGRTEAGHRHSLLLFVGTASSAERHETAVAVGPSYRYLLTRRLAVGPVVEMTCYRSETSTVALGGVFLKPYRGLELALAPGVEWITGTVDAGESVVERGEFTFRLALAYRVAMPHVYSIAPEAAVDLGSSATVRYGLAFGIAF